jgi:hypothetical protein
MSLILYLVGSSGEELDTLDIYDVRTDAWRTVVPVPDSQFRSPAARALCGVVPVPFVSPRYPRAPRSCARITENVAHRFSDTLRQASSGMIFGFSRLGPRARARAWARARARAWARASEPELAWRYVLVPKQETGLRLLHAGGSSPPLGRMGSDGGLTVAQ